MELFIISYGLGGGFRGAKDYEVVQTVDLEDAEKWAFESACESYEKYAGMYGLRDESQIMEEDECDEEDARFTYEEERESWLEYTAVPYSKEVENKVKNYHYHNRYPTLPICSFTLKAKIPPLSKVLPKPTTLGQHLRKVRIERDIQQQVVAKTLGAYSMSLSSWELNRKAPHPKYYRRIIDFLGYIPKLKSHFDHLGTRVLLYLDINNITLEYFCEINKLPIDDLHRLMHARHTKLEIQLVKKIEKSLKKSISSSFATTA